MKDDHSRASPQQDTKDTHRKELLIKALRDPDEKVRIAAARALEKVEAKEKVDDLGMTLLKGGKVEKLRALYALGEIRNDRALLYLLKALKDPLEDVRASVIRVLGNIRDVRTTKAIVKMLNDSSKAVRLAAIDALGLFKDRRVVPYLLMHLNTGDREVLVRAIEALGRIGDKRAEKKLMELAHKSDPPLKALIIQALGDLEI